MKNLGKLALSLAVCTTLANAEKIEHIFEPAKDTSGFSGVEFEWSSDLVFYYQDLEQNYGSDLKGGMVLPTANLDFDAKVMSGFNVKLETMLSSHHHNETYVKGGYATIDNLDFISKDFGKGFMDNATIKIGVNDINFGDHHFRRTDNADTFRNPFVNNMGVEAYMQAGFIEVLYRIPSIDSFVMGGITNGQVKPDDVKAGDGKSNYSYYAKAGWDSQISDDTRVRITESVYVVEDTKKNSLYQGDKAGYVARSIFDDSSNTFNNGYDLDSFGAGWNALTGYRDLTTAMTNIFVQYKGTEFFGLVELADGKNQSEQDFEMLHYSAELVQRFGSNDNFYAAVRYENATVERATDSADDEMTQMQYALGWLLSENAVMKLEYIDHERKNIAVYGKDVKYDGIMIAAGLSF